MADSDGKTADNHIQMMFGKQVNGLFWSERFLQTGPFSGNLSFITYRRWFTGYSAIWIAESRQFSYRFMPDEWRCKIAMKS